MYKIYLISCLFLIIISVCVNGCLITNCPRGGKRGGKIPITERHIKPVSRNTDACHTDRECGTEERIKAYPDNPAGLDLYNLINYPSETFNDK
nr:unnamed protein product [Callosobruchus analis]